MWNQATLTDARLTSCGILGLAVVRLIEEHVKVDDDVVIYHHFWNLVTKIVRSNLCQLFILFL